MEMDGTSRHDDLVPKKGSNVPFRLVRQRKLILQLMKTNGIAKVHGGKPGKPGELSFKCAHVLFLQHECMCPGSCYGHKQKLKRES